MKAFLMKDYGGPEVAELQDDVPQPDPGEGEVLVEVRSAGLNPVDFKIREGKLRPIIRLSLPTILGGEVSGIVHSVGSNVSRFSVGDRVFARLGKQKMGGLAEFSVVREEYLAKIPDSLDFDSAAALPLAGLTALQSLRDEIGVQPGQRILITGGAGGVGTFAIQIAKHLGATVVTTASHRGEELVRRMGADEVIDYESEEFDEILSDCDAAFDLIGGEDLKRCFSAVKSGGIVVSIAGVPEPKTALRDLDRRFGLAALFWILSFPTRCIAAKAGVDYRFKFMHPSGKDLEFLGSLIEKQQLEVVLDSVFPFDKVKEAFAELEKGHAKGKIVVKVSE